MGNVFLYRILHLIWNRPAIVTLCDRTQVARCRLQLLFHARQTYSFCCFVMLYYVAVNETLIYALEHLGSHMI